MEPPPREPEAPPQRLAAMPRPARAAQPAPRSAFGSPLVATLTVLFVLLAGGGAFLGFTPAGQEVMRGLVKRLDPLLAGGRAAAPGYDVENATGHYEIGQGAGRMFVIKGAVKNVGRSAKSGVKVHAAILDAGSREIAKSSAYAGNVPAADALRHAGREKLEAELANRFGQNLVNMDIAPGKSVPFMIIFFDAPDGVDAYRVEATDGD